MHFDILYWAEVWVIQWDLEKQMYVQLYDIWLKCVLEYQSMLGAFENKDDVLMIHSIIPPQ